MRTTIESADRSHRAILVDGPDGVEVQLLRHAGSIDCRGAGVDGPSMWRQLQKFTIDKPFHRVADKVVDLVHPMTRQVSPYATARRF